MSFTIFNSVTDALARYPAEEANAQPATQLVQRHPTVRSLLTFLEETHPLWSAGATEPNPWPFAATVATILTRSNDPVRFAQDALAYARAAREAGIEKADPAIALATLEALQGLQRLDPVGTAHWTPVTGFQLGNKPTALARWPLLLTERPGAAPMEVASIHNYAQASRVARVLNGDVAAANEQRDELYRARIRGQGDVEVVIDESPDDSGQWTLRGRCADGATAAVPLAAASDAAIARRICNALNGELPEPVPSAREARMADLLRSTLGALVDLKEGHSWREMGLDVETLSHDAAALGVRIPEEPDEPWSETLCTIAGIELAPNQESPGKWFYVLPGGEASEDFVSSSAAADAAIERYFPREDWVREVSEGDTSRSYEEWVLSMAEQLADEVAYEGDHSPAPGPA